jgi:hypothetical protein
MVKFKNRTTKINIMKNLLFCLLMTLFCFGNNLYSQVKTPYEKKKEEISIRFLKKMGITTTEINQAKELGDMGLILLMGQAIQNMEAKDPLEALSIMAEFDKEIKATEKLKSEADFKKEREKKDAAERKQNLAIQERQRLENERQQKEKENQNKLNQEKKKQEQETRYKNSDYVQIINSVSTNFNSWLKKNEFEKSEDYNIRIQERGMFFDSICDEVIKKQIYLQTHMNREHESEADYYNDEANPPYYIEVMPYNADLEFFPIKIHYREFEFSESLNIPIEDAKTFKNDLENFEIFLPESVIDWCFMEHYLFPRKIFIEHSSSNKRHELILSLKNQSSKFIFTSSEMNLTNFQFEEIKYDSENYELKRQQYLIEQKEKQFNTYIDKATESEKNGLLDESLSLYKKALTLKPDAKTVVSKIELVTFQINEIKREKLISDADVFITKGSLNEAKDILIRANDIRQTEEITLRINDLIYKINEIKRDAIIQQAKEFNSKGMLTKSIEKYKEANKIRQTQDITTIVSEIEKIRTNALNNNYKLDSLYKRVTSDDYELFKDLVKPSQLDLIKEGYGLRYSSCETTLYKKLGEIWDPLSNQFESLGSNRNKEIWNDEYKTLLNNMIQFDITFKSYMVFESRVYKALLESDKKYLKVFKQDDDNEIIETVIKTEN